MTKNYVTNHVITTFNSKSFSIHSPFKQGMLVRVSIPKICGSRISSAATLGDKFYIVIQKNVVLEIDSLKLFQTVEDDVIVLNLSGSQPAGVRVINVQSLPIDVRLSSDYAAWAISSDLRNAVQLNSEGLHEFIGLNLAEEDRSSIEPVQMTNSVFGITCCGASISSDLNYSLIGDFSGNIHLFQNKRADTPIKHLKSISLEAAVRYIHFHDFVENFALIGGYDGKLKGLVFQEIGGSSDDNLFHEIQDIYQTENNAAITTIRTSRVKGSPEEYYITLGDVRGNLHVLRGTGAESTSYRPVTVMQAHAPSTDE